MIHQKYGSIPNSYFLTKKDYAGDCISYDKKRLF